VAAFVIAWRSVELNGTVDALERVMKIVALPAHIAAS
jgi:hypothetical protein